MEWCSFLFTFSHSFARRSSNHRSTDPVIHLLLKLLSQLPLRSVRYKKNFILFYHRTFNKGGRPMYRKRTNTIQFTYSKLVVFMRKSENLKCLLYILSQPQIHMYCTWIFSSCTKQVWPTWKTLCRRKIKHSTSP